MVEIPSEVLWMVILGFIISFILAFGIGANDVANSFGTSVGAKVLTLRQACFLASVFETLGAILIGSKVSDTIRKGIIGVEEYQNNTELLMVGNVAALSGSCVWLIVATLLRMPVSATHSIVGATIGFALVAHGAKGINWIKLGTIIASWFVSPLLAGGMATGIFWLCKVFILSKDDPLEPGLRALPIFYAFTIMINLFSILYDGPEMLHFDKIPLWGAAVGAVGAGLICGLVVQFVVVPWQRRKIKEKCSYDAVCQKNLETQVCLQDVNGMNGKGDADCKLENGNMEKQHLQMVLDNKDLVESTHNMSCLHNPHLHNVMPPNHASKILTDITHPPSSPTKTVPPVSIIKPGINKKEDAALIDNEYNLGMCTPKKSSPAGDFTTKNIENAANACVIMENGNSKPKVSFKDTGDDSSSQNSSQGEETKLSEGRSIVVDRPETVQLFSVLQILTAVFGSFAHGGNDVSNAISPLVSLWILGTTGLISAKTATPPWILFYGGCGISLGLWIWGRRVIKTLGEDLTKITPSSGFCIEVGSALTVLIASNIGIPISTTHCKVGSVVFVGRFRSRENVDWSIFRNIVLAWLVTLPVCGGISAAIMKGLMLTI